MKKKTPTKKQTEQALVQLISEFKIVVNNQQILANKVFRSETLWNLYLEYNNEFNKIVKEKEKELEQIESENKKGT